MENEKPQFKSSYDFETDYIYGGKKYRVRVGAHRNLTNQDYFPKVVKCIGTVMYKPYGTPEAHEFPSPEVVKVFAEMEGLHLVGARWTKDFSDVEYDGERGELWEDDHTVYLKEYAAQFRPVYGLSDCANWKTNQLGDCGGRMMVKDGIVLCETCLNRPKPNDEQVEESTSSMDLTELQTKFEEVGYRRYKSGREDRGVVFLLQKRVLDLPEGTPGCLHNDDRVHFNVEVLSWGLERSVTFQILGGYREGRSISIDIYGVRFETAVAEREQIEREVLAAWIAACKAGGR